MMTLVAQELAIEADVPASAFDFDSWMRSEQKRVFVLCWRMLADRDEADTATQDVFLKAHRALARNSGEVADLTRWVTRIAVNTCLDRLRSRRWRFWRRRLDAESEEGFWRGWPDGSPAADDKIYARQIASRLQHALNRLSGRQRAVFLLRHFEGKPLEEIGAILGLETGSVKSHMFRATAKLREELKDLYRLRETS